MYLIQNVYSEAYHNILKVYFEATPGLWSFENLLRRKVTPMAKRMRKRPVVFTICASLSLATYPAMFDQIIFSRWPKQAAATARARKEKGSDLRGEFGEKESGKAESPLASKKQGCQK